MLCSLGTSCSKAATDKAYDDALVLLLRRISTDLKKNPTGVPLVGAYFGTHNKESCELVKDRLVAEGLGEEVKETGRIRLMDGVAGRVCTGQLYGEFSGLSFKSSYATPGMHRS
jgi:proline dehydrogenase